MFCSYFYILKGVVYHNHKHGCQKCEVVGTFSKVSNTTIFAVPAVVVKRTDVEFRRGFMSTVLPEGEEPVDHVYKEHYNSYETHVPAGPL